MNRKTIKELIKEYQELDKPIKLNLGCYNKPIHGFINIDIREDTLSDCLDDVFELTTVPNNSIDVIFASHLLEHKSRNDSKNALMRWNEILKSGGQLYLAVPDMECVFAHYFYHKKLSDLFSALGGSQRHEYDYHLSHFDFDTLKNLLEDSGYSNIERYDPWKTEWFYCDNYSQAYVPHMDRNGKLMSLNIKAYKI